MTHRLIINIGRLGSGRRAQTHAASPAAAAARVRPSLLIQRVVMLRRIDPEQGVARFYLLMIERDLFGAVRLVRQWGPIGAMQGHELAQDFPTEEEALAALERLAAAKRRRSGGEDTATYDGAVDLGSGGEDCARRRSAWLKGLRGHELCSPHCRTCTSFWSRMKPSWRCSKRTCCSI